MGNPHVLPIPNGCIVSWGPTKVEVSNLQPRRNGYFAEIQVYYDDNLIHNSMCSLMDASKTQNICRRLRFLDKEKPWETYIEIAILHAVDCFQRQNPVRDMADLVAQDHNFAWVCKPFIASQRPTIIYGKGGSGKSYFALFLACLMQNGLQMEPFIKVHRAMNVLYLDYESDEEDMGHRARGLQEAYDVFVELPRYRKCDQPMINECGFLSKIIKTERIETLIIDSLAPATGADLMSSDAPMTFFRTLRSLGCNSLILAHPPKNIKEGDEDTVYGNAFFQNLARSIWAFKRAPMSEHIVGLFHRKSNYGYYPHQCWQIDFGFNPWSVSFSNASVEDTDLEKELSIADRLIIKLKKIQAASAEQLAELLDMPKKVGVIVKVLKRDSRFDSTPNKDGQEQWFICTP